jgi:ribose-phosphate pyrophosphokinase
MSLEPAATTELIRLPGLDEVVVTTQPSGGHFIERTAGKRLMVVAGRSHPELAQNIAEHIGIELGTIELETFANGETYVRYDESIRGTDLFLVQTGCSPIDRNIMELAFMIQAAKLASARRITAVMPLFARHFRDLGLTGEGVVSVSPDAGRAKQAVRFAEMLEAEFALMHKTRHSARVVEITEITGRVRGKRAILGDDVIMTGGTILANVKALREHGVEEVWVFATHGLFCEGSIERFQTPDITGMVVTDTVPIDPLTKPDNMTVLPVAPLLAETIMNVFSDDSVSAIFGGENQLF